MSDSCKENTSLRVCVFICVCSTAWQCPVFHLEQQLVLHDPLDRFDEQVVELQPVAQLLAQLLKAETDTATRHRST